MWGSAAELAGGVGGEMHLLYQEMGEGGAGDASRERE